MSKSSDNRKQRRKRDKRHLIALCHKRLDEQVHKDNNGTNPKYYDVVFASIKTDTVNGHRRVRAKAGVRPNAKYFALMEQLAEMCKGVTVEIPREMVGGSDSSP